MRDLESTQGGIILMQYKPLTRYMTNEEIEVLWKDIFNINEIIFIERDSNNDRIIVKFETIWGSGTEDDPYFKVIDMVVMYSDEFEEPDFLVTNAQRFKYKQYMIAKGYSKYWEDNSYID